MKNISTRQRVIGMNVGDELNFPIEKVASIRTLCQMLKVTHKMFFTTRTSQEENLLILTRIA